MGSLTTAGKNLALNAIAFDKASLHSADPTDNGSAAELSGGSYARKNVTFAASTVGSRNATLLPTFDVPAGSLVAFSAFWVGANCVGTQRLNSKHSAAANNNSGDGSITIKTPTVNAATPSTGTITIDGDSYEYTGRVNNVFTITGTLSRNYTEDAEVLAPIPQHYDGDGVFSLTSATVTA